MGPHQFPVPWLNWHSLRGARVRTKQGSVENPSIRGNYAGNGATPHRLNGSVSFPNGHRTPAASDSVSSNNHSRQSTERIPMDFSTQRFPRGYPTEPFNAEDSTERHIDAYSGASQSAGGRPAAGGSRGGRACGHLRAGGLPICHH